VVDKSDMRMEHWYSDTNRETLSKWRKPVPEPLYVSALFKFYSKKKVKII
jgi:hypothetical protein